MIQKYLQQTKQQIKDFYNKIIIKFDFKDKKSSKNKSQKKEMGWFETLIYAALLAVFFRSLFYEPFHIPSSSMKPNLLIGDYVFVSKLSYGYSKYSFPFGDKFNYFNGRIFSSEPQRGDVAVFRLPSEDSINYIKRVIGLPGDKIQMTQGILYINGNRVEKEFDGFFTELDEVGAPFDIMQYRENISNKKKFLVLDQISEAPQDNTRVYVVPQGHYFFMGDNRDNSRDSRYGDVGFVPHENLVGKAKIIFFSNPKPIWQPINWIKSVRFSRIFDVIN